MINEVVSKEYKWRFVTADQRLTSARCELCYANIEPSAGAGIATIYNGDNTTGEKIIALLTAVKTNWEFAPKQPVYCDKGLYVDVGDNCTGVFVQWREFHQ